MRIGDFEIIAPLGKGAGSTIFKIRRRDDKKLYALKVIRTKTADDMKYVEQVEHEFNVGRQLDHPNIVKIYAYEPTKWLLWVNGARLLLEYVDGLPLSECRELPLPRLLKIFARAAKALGHMHEKGFFHADTKPDNIMVTPEGDVKLIDFGLAWVRGLSKDRVQGTIEFLAPEQATKKKVNVKTEIFNLGATMYRMLSGKPVPSMIQSGLGKLGRIDDLVKPIRDSNPQIPEELDQLVIRCCRFDPAERPGSMGELRTEIKTIARRLKAADVEDE